MSGASRRPWALAAAGVVMIGAGAVLLLRSGLAGVPAPVTVGSAAPAFTVSTVSQPRTSRSLADYAGHPLLLNLWATWCLPCREEMPSFERLYRDYAGRGLRIAAVSVDDPSADGTIRDFVRQYELTFDVLHDRRSRLMPAYQVRGVPQTILISAAGTIVGTQFARDWASPQSRALVDSLLFDRRR